MMEHNPRKPQKLFRAHRHPPPDDAEKLAFHGHEFVRRKVRPQESFERDDAERGVNVEFVGEDERRCEESVGCAGEALYCVFSFY